MTGPVRVDVHMHLYPSAASGDWPISPNAPYRPARASRARPSAISSSVDVETSAGYVFWM